MAEVYDADGNVIEGYLSAEEVAAKLEAEKATWEASQKKEEPPVVTTPAVDEPPVWAKSLMEQVERLSGNQRTTLVKDFTSGLDADKQKEFDAKYNALSGYDETPAGIQKRAQDAYLLTTGQPFNSTEINMQNIVGSTGSIVKPTPPKPEVDQAFKTIFGISDEDVTKYGNK